MRNGDGVFSAVGNVVASERKTCRVEMIETLVNAFLGTHRKGNLTKQQVTALGVDLIEAAAEFKAIEHVGTHPRAK